MRRIPIRPAAQRGTALGVLLALTVAFSALLAYEAYQAARSHQLTAERALRDYAAVAAWELLAAAGDDVRDAARRGLAPAVEGKAASPYEPLAPPDVIAPSADGALRCSLAADDARRFYFRLDLRSGELATSGAVPSPVERAWVADTVRADVRARYAPGEREASLIGAGRGRGRAVAYAVKYAPFDAPIAVYGLVTCASAFGAPLFGPVMARHPLLPA